MQLKLPSKFLHTALSPQLSMFVAHSSISEEMNSKMLAHISHFLILTTSVWEYPNISVYTYHSTTVRVLLIIIVYDFSCWLLTQYVLSKLKIWHLAGACLHYIILNQFSTQICFFPVHVHGHIPACIHIYKITYIHTCTYMWKLLAEQYNYI